MCNQALIVTAFWIPNGWCFYYVIAFVWAQKAFALSRNVNSKKFFELLRNEHPYNTPPQVVINRAKFDSCMLSSLGKVKAHVSEHRFSFCVLDKLSKFSPTCPWYDVTSFTHLHHFVFSQVATNEVLMVMREQFFVGRTTEWMITLTCSQLFLSTWLRLNNNTIKIISS